MNSVLVSSLEQPVGVISMPSQHSQDSSLDPPQKATSSSSSSPSPNLPSSPPGPPTPDIPPTDIPSSPPLSPPISETASSSNSKVTFPSSSSSSSSTSPSQSYSSSASLTLSMTSTTIHQRSSSPSPPTPPLPLSSLILSATSSSSPVTNSEHSTLPLVPPSPTSPSSTSSSSSSSMSASSSPSPTTSPGVATASTTTTTSTTTSTMAPNTTDTAATTENADPKDKIRNEMQEVLLKLKEIKSSWASEEAAKLAKAVGDLYWTYKCHQTLVASTFCELEGAELFINMLLTLTKKGLFSSNPTWQTCFYCYNTLWNLSDACLNLALRLGQKGMVKICTTNISHKPYRDHMAQKNVSFLIKASLNILHNLVKAPGNRHIFREEGVVEKVEPFLEGDPYLKAISTMTLAYIVEEGQEEILADKGRDTIQYLVDTLKEAQTSEDKRSQGLSNREVATALGRLAVHDNNKSKILEAGGLPLFMNMLRSECQEVQEAAVMAVWNLAFSDDVSAELRKNAECMKALRALSNSDSTDVAKAANGALWVINKEAEKKEAEKKEEEQKEEFDETASISSIWRKKPHIMISYQWGAQPLVLRIRDALSSAGYRVWVDVDCMYGSTLQAMAEAIENACAVVMCMSERYKESPNCRTEAEYAFQLRKRIIPVMMEEYYRPDGWLGIILGAKFYMDFSGRLNAEEEMTKLVKEVQMHGTEARLVQVDDTDEGLISATITIPTESAGIRPRVDCQDWTIGQVQDWLTENDLQHLRPALSEYTGKDLQQLHKMRQEAPDFFYASIKEDFGTRKLLDILRFTEALDALIKD